MTNVFYRKGYRFELRVKKKLEKRNFYVIRSARSHGIFDLVAIREGKVYGIQCKTDGRLSKKLKDTIIEISKKHKITPLLAFSNKRQIEFIDLTNNEEIEL